MIGQFFSSLTNKLFTGALILALAFCTVQTVRLGWANSDVKKANANLKETQSALAMSEARHTITRQSVTTLETKLAAMIEAGQLTRKSVQDALTATKQQTDAMRSDADVIGALVGENCQTPAEIMELEL
jgi:septal ring factor EnvC (AmiA/AmiB activator)